VKQLGQRTPLSGDVNDNAEDGAFVENFEVRATDSGPLGGLSFAVKDLIDIDGHITGCGNPTWRRTHPPASVNAVCVDQLLEAGARCVGKTVTDELAFSLLGENHFYGTPLNPRAPGRVPGGSSSGSASAVARGLVDFALGTDTGGSVRVPANNCGVWGLRPSHGFVSVAGVNAFAPTFDTVGVLARNAQVLVRVAEALLACDVVPDEEPATIHLLEEAFSVADTDVRKALDDPVGRLRKLFEGRVRVTSLREIDGGGGNVRRGALANVVRRLQRAPVGGDRKLPRCLGETDQTGVRARSRAKLRAGQGVGPPSGGAGRTTPRGVLPKTE
jgi:amidase